MNEACATGDHFFREPNGTVCTACGYRIYPRCGICSKFVPVTKAVCDDC